MYSDHKIYTIVYTKKGYAVYEWDEEKRLKNIEKHGIDFIRVKEMWNYPVCEMISPQTDHSEKRFLAIGRLNKIHITVVYTWRGDNRRIISARKARKNEEKYYKDETRRRT